MPALDQVLPLRSLHLTEVQQVFALLAQEHWSKGQAAQWANERWLLADQQALAFLPPQAESPLWDALLFLLGIDLLVSPGEYLHNTEDIREYSRKFEQQVKHLL